MPGYKRKYDDNAPVFQQGLPRGVYKPAYTARPTKMLKTTPKMGTNRRRRNYRSAGFLGIETKYLDVYGVNVAVPSPANSAGAEMQPTGGCTQCLSAPSQGDGPQQRDGRAIQFKSIFINGFLSTDPLEDQANVAIPQEVFVALVMDTQANGATVTSQQVFTNPAANANANGFLLRNMEYSSRYKVLDHCTVNLGPATAGTDGANTNSVQQGAKSFQLKWRGEVPIKFTSGNTADVINVENVAFHLLAFGTVPSWDTYLTFNSRMRFRG